MRVRLAATREQGAAGTLEDALARWFTPSYLAAEGPRVEDVRRWVLGADPEMFAQVRQVLATGVTELIRPEPPLGLPALVMTCAGDSGSTPEMTRAMVAEIPGAESIIVPGLRHLGMIEDPKEFISPLMTFLDRHLG